MTKYLAVPDSSALTVLLPRLRDRARLSQKRLGELAGVARSAVAAIEQGKTRPKADTLRLIAIGLATDEGGHNDPELTTGYYAQLMQAAGYTDPATPSPVEVRPTAELTDAEIETALNRYFEDGDAAISFMGTIRRWQQLPRAAKLAILDTLRDADRMADRAEQMQRESRTRQRG